MLDRFDDNVRDSLGMIDKRSYEDYIEKYILHINAHIKKEKLKNPVTGQFDSPDMFFVQEVEKNLNIKDEIESYRSHLISKLGAFHLDNPGIAIAYVEVFPRLVKDLKFSFKEEQKKKIKNISENLVYYRESQLSEDKSSHLLKDEARNEIEQLLTCLQEKHQYSKKGSMSLLGYLIKNCY